MVDTIIVAEDIGNTETTLPFFLSIFAGMNVQPFVEIKSPYNALHVCSAYLKILYEFASEPLGCGFCSGKIRGINLKEHMSRGEIKKYGSMIDDCAQFSSWIWKIPTQTHLNILCKILVARTYVARRTIHDSKHIEETVKHIVRANYVHYNGGEHLPNTLRDILCIRDNKGKNLYGKAIKLSVSFIENIIS